MVVEVFLNPGCNTMFSLYLPKVFISFSLENFGKLSSL